MSDDFFRDGPLRGRFFDREGKPVESFARWSALFQDETYARVAEDTVGRYTISTVWIGVNMRYTPGLPLIFETLIFEPDPAGYNRVGEWGARYANEEEARIGYAAGVEYARKTNAGSGALEAFRAIISAAVAESIGTGRK